MSHQSLRGQQITLQKSQSVGAGDFGLKSMIALKSPKIALEPSNQEFARDAGYKKSRNLFSTAA